MQKKKIIIISLKGGFGHVSTSNAIQNALKDEYQISVKYLFEDCLPELDFIARITKKRLSFISLYNSFLQRSWVFMLKLFGYIGHFIFLFQRKKAFQLFGRLMEQEKPDCVISVMGILNDALLKAVRGADIPFLLIPTDIDARWYFLQNLSWYVFPKFYLCIMFYNDYVKKQIANFQIPELYVHFIGPVARPDFFEYKNHDAIRNMYQLPDHKPIIMIVMGGYGSIKLLSYAKALSQFPLEIHLLLCVGKNEEIKKEIANISFAANVTYTCISFTERISDLMSVSTVIITKSGTLSLLEGMVMQKPLFLDATSSVLPWEQYNHRLVEEGYGDSIIYFPEIEKNLLEYLQNHELQIDVQNHYTQLKTKNGTEEIKKLLQEIL